MASRWWPCIPSEGVREHRCSGVVKCIRRHSQFAPHNHNMGCFVVLCEFSTKSCYLGRIVCLGIVAFRVMWVWI